MPGKRIMIVGNAGNGKSTLAIKLGNRLNLPVVHLDRLFWRSGWKSVSNAEFDALLAAEVARDAWIIDGNYTRTIRTRLDRSDTVVWLDYPRCVSLWGIIRRRIVYRNKPRPDLAEGCPEKIDAEFFRWVWSFNKKHRAMYRALFQAEKDKELIVFRRRREAESWLESLKRHDPGEIQ